MFLLLVKLMQAKVSFKDCILNIFSGTLWKKNTYNSKRKIMIDNRV